MNKPVRVIFLDFDGVLNNGASVGSHRERNRDNYGGWDPACVSALNWLLKMTGAYIVISSSWKISRSVDHLAGILEGAGVNICDPENVLVDDLYESSHRIIDRTPIIAGPRSADFQVEGGSKREGLPS